MSASDVTTIGSAGMSSDSSSAGMANKITSGWASPAVLGFLVFGLMTILLGLALLPKPYGNGFTATLVNVTIVGYAAAAVLALVGLIALLEGQLYWGSAWLGFAGFWASWSYATHHGAYAASGFGESGVLFLWILFTATFLISSFKHGWGTFFAFLFLEIAFILLTIAFWQTGGGTKISVGEHWAIGGETIFTGLVWWYAGTASLTNHTYGKRILPT